MTRFLIQLVTAYVAILVIEKLRLHRKWEQRLIYAVGIVTVLLLVVDCVGFFVLAMLASQP